MQKIKKRWLDAVMREADAQLQSGAVALPWARAAKQAKRAAKRFERALGAVVVLQSQPMLAQSVLAQSVLAQPVLTQSAPVRALARSS